MKRVRSNQQGFGHLALLLVVVVVLAVAAVGWRVMDNKTPAGSGAGNTAAANAVPATLKTTADVTRAANALNALQVDSTVNPNQLDSDISSLL